MKASTAAVLRLLEARPEGVTALDALHAGCGDRLAARVHELRESGHDVRGAWESTDGGARVKRYRLAARPPVYRGAQEHLPL